MERSHKEKDRNPVCNKNIYGIRIKTGITVINSHLLNKSFTLALVRKFRDRGSRTVGNKCMIKLLLINRSTILYLILMLPLTILFFPISILALLLRHANILILCQQNEEEIDKAVLTIGAGHFR